MKLPYIYSYKDLSKLSGLSTNSLSIRANRLHLKGVFGSDSAVYFNKIQALRIVNYLSYGIKNNPKKIEAVEMYIARLGIKNIAKKLLMTNDSISSYAKEYRESGFLIVESSMNLNHIEL